MSAFKYRAADERAWRRRLLSYKFDPALVEAAKGKTQGLSDYLRSDAPLDEQKREALAALIERRLQSKKPGRPHGPVATRRDEVKRAIVSAVRRVEERWRKAHPNRALPRGMRTTLINEVGERFGEDGDLQGIFEITVDEIKQILERGRKRPPTLP